MAHSSDARLNVTASRDHGLDVIERRLALVEISSLKQYERPKSIRVREIERSLCNTGTLVNPVVVDPFRQLLIDGHHRVAALYNLGLERVPAYTVDYHSEVVRVLGWKHIATVEHDVIRSIYGRSLSHAGGAWQVTAQDPQSAVVAERFFKDPLPSVEFLEQVSSCLAERGFSVSLVTDGHQIGSGQIGSMVYPTVGKEQVLAAATSGKPFPAEVNRHIIDGRPLGMHIPLKRTADIDEFRRFVEDLFLHAAPCFASPGAMHDGRLYDERVTLFGRRRALEDLPRALPPKDVESL